MYFGEAYSSVCLRLGDHLCSLQVRVPGYSTRGSVFDFQHSIGSGTGPTQPREDN
jgi:hypothetical protein